MSVRARLTCRTECTYMYCLVYFYAAFSRVLRESTSDQKRKLRYTLLCYVVELAVGSEQKLYFCYDSSAQWVRVTIVIEQVRRDISSVKQAYVKLACNRVISPGISHIACESVETAIQTFMFGCLFSIFHHAIKNVSLIENTDQTFSL